MIEVLHFEFNNSWVFIDEKLLKKLIFMNYKQSLWKPRRRIKIRCI